MSHQSYVSRRLCLTKPYVSRGLCLTDLMSHGGLMSHGTGLCLTETAAESSQMLAGVAPGTSASDYLLVSRATRKILSPFGAPPMYSGWAYVPPKSLCSTTYVPPLCSRGAYVPPAYVPGWGLCSTDRAYVPPNDRANRPRCLQVSHLERRRPITFSRDTQSPQPFWAGPCVRACLPRRHVGEETSRGDIPRRHPEETS